MLKWERKAILTKVESVYGTDSTPAGATDAVLARDVELMPLEQIYDDRNLVTPFMGLNNGKVVAGSFARLNYKVELAASGAAGTAPKYSASLKGCALAETVVPATSVAYNPISSAEQSVSKYFYIDGRLHKLLGAMGDVDLVLEAGKIPYFQFRFVGLFAVPTDAALPAVTVTGFQKPLPVNSVNTTPFTLHTYAGKFRRMEIKLGNDVRYRNLPNSEAVRWVGRNPTGSFTLEEELIAGKDWWTIIKAATTGALACTHGTAAGNKVAIAAAQVQLSEPRQSQEDSIVMLTMNAELQQTMAGNDELSITLT